MSNRNIINIKTSLVGLAALLNVVGLAFLFIFSPGGYVIIIIIIITGKLKTTSCILTG